MSSVEVTNCVKRKNDEVVDKVKKKKKKKHDIIEVVETKKENDGVIEKVEKKKKKKRVETKDESDDITEIEKSDTTVCTESNNKSKTKKARELATVTIAVPGSILDNAQSPEFRTYLAGQIARAACIYKIDEVCPIDCLLTCVIKYFFLFNFFYVIRS